MSRVFVVVVVVAVLFFSLVLKLYAKWGWLVSHIFFVCVLIDSDFF